MAPILTARRRALLTKAVASGCVPAKAILPDRSTEPIYDCIEAVAGVFQKSDKEMCALLGIAQSNYSRRTYNAARVQRLPDDMRQLFIEYLAQIEGLKVNLATPHEQIKTAAKLAIVNLLELMESA